MNSKPYKPEPHPMQHRLEQFRVIPSLVTGSKRPDDKYEPIPFAGLINVEAQNA